MFRALHESLMGVTVEGKGRAALTADIEAMNRIESAAASHRLACVARLAELEDESAAATVLRSATKCSTRAAKRAVKTATSLEQMPSLKGALARGEITTEHADVAADAAERVGPEEADVELVGTARARPADLFRRDAGEWANRKEALADQQDRHERQRRSRSGAVFTGDQGMEVLHAEFDAVTGQSVRKAVDAEVDRLWRADGGRDGTPDEVRTPAQRRADAIANLLLRRGGSAQRPHPRYLSVLRVDVDRCRAEDPSGVAEFIDGTPVPQPVLERIACDTAFVGAVYDRDGAVLWQGRQKRLATDDQWVALVERDGGCFCCGADPSRCEAHHLVPWNLGGSTDIDAMVLVCTNTHHLIHDHGWMIKRIDGAWVLVNPGEMTSGETRAPPRDRAA